MKSKYKGQIQKCRKTTKGLFSRLYYNNWIAQVEPTQLQSRSDFCTNHCKTRNIKFNTLILNTLYWGWDSNVDF